MALTPGTHELGPDAGTVQVRTYREGVAQKVGHDLIIDAPAWRATIGVSSAGTPESITLELDSRALSVREGLHGLKPLSDKDRSDIIKNINDKVLRGQPVSFASSRVEPAEGTLQVAGSLTITGTARPVDFQLSLAPDGRLTGTLPVTQSQWGIKPYRGLMGALKVRDDVEVVIDVRLPAG